MSKKNKQDAQATVAYEQIELTSDTKKTTDAELMAKQQKLKVWEDSLKEREEAIAQTERTLIDQRVELEEKELQAKNGFPQLFQEKFSTVIQGLEQREAQCTKDFASLEATKDALRHRELAIQQAEIARDKEYADKRAELDQELFSRRKKQENELESKRANDLNNLEEELFKIRESRRSTLEKELYDRLESHNVRIKKEEDELAGARRKLLEELARIDEDKDDLDYQRKRLQSRKSTLDDREANLNTEIDAKIIERKHSFESEKTILNDEISRLRESIKTSSALVANFEVLKHKLGDEDPATVLLKLKTYEEDIKKLREDLAVRPTQEMQASFDRLKTEQSVLQQTCKRLSEDNERLKKSERTQSDLEMKIAELSNENKSLHSRYDFVQADNDEMKERLDKLKRSYERVQDREDRIKDIEAPYIKLELPRAHSDIEEIQWLDNISKFCLEYGLRFPRRILNAFHTALKTSEWSPLTVLSGVSGTGKSELPRLYSHFGGINFLSLSVQPNWDSQESMLGFFNSIDNRFDARPVLQLLAQSQKKRSEDYPYGLEDTVSLILMDEMNLAHVELYFAEFLSKLELRRGRGRLDVPCLDVSLGAGIKPDYSLPLGRNVLWAGTMNQDETTKSLSDKVLDRGIVINFPRPITLERRRQLKPLGKQAPLLPYGTWSQWWCKESQFSDQQILPFKTFVEEMNTSLSRVGRALGHRVWQAVEYYMANYPDVMQAQKNNDDVALAKAMKTAFEDQLVQKVMPKLRGIETRGKSKSDCLDRIRTQLVNDDYIIVDDFDLACEFGYGQFIWNSANYLKDDEIVNDEVDHNQIESDQEVAENC